MDGEGHPDLDVTVALARLDGYVLHERIGEGGMGVVRRATDGRGNVVAVKLLHPHVASDAESRARFAREARVLSRVRGPHIAEVLDADVISETPYLVTRYIHGSPLLDAVRRNGPLTGGDLADLAGDLADALGSIHDADIIHRDLKPGNVLLENGVAFVIDFGIAQIADDTRMTRAGLTYGTPGYVAPEVLSGNVISPAGDVHAWAATVAFAATGRSPFGSGPLEAVAFRVLQDEPDLSGCPDWLQPVLQRCFAKRPEHRPTARELLHWLETGEPPQAHPTPTLVFPEEPPQARPLGNPEPAVPTEPAAPAPIPEPGDHPAAQHARRSALRLVGIGLLAALALFAANAPLLAIATAAGWLLLARTADRAARHLESRRSYLGTRRSDGVVATLALPWHFGRAALVTLLTAPIALGGAAVVAILIVMIAYVAGSKPQLDVLLGISGLAGTFFAWRGFDGKSVRRGTRRVLAGTLRTPGAAIAAVIVLGCITVLLVALAAVGPPLWWPIENPLHQLSGEIQARVLEFLKPR